MRHGLILELCQNRTVISMSEKELISLHLCPPTLPAIVPVISQHLNWLSWGWFWTAWCKAPPLEGGCQRLRLSDCSSLLSSCSFFWKCSNASPVLCAVPNHQVVWINAFPAVILLLMTLTGHRTVVSSVGCADHRGLYGTSCGAEASRSKSGPMPLAELSSCNSDLHPLLPWKRPYWRRPGNTSEVRRHTVLSSSTSTLTQLVLWINSTATLCTGAWQGRGGWRSLAFIFSIFIWSLCL